MSNTRSASGHLHRVFVTGSAGFLGSEIIRQLQSDGIPYTPSEHPTRVPSPRQEIVPFDILDPDQIRGKLANSSTVIHAAGLAHVFNPIPGAPARFMAVNATGTLNLAREALMAGVKHFILVSSVSVYGTPKSSAPLKEDSSCRPSSEYGHSKLAAEHGLQKLAVGSSMQVTILRMATLFGKGDPGNVARLIRTILGGNFLWIGQGDNLKSLIHVFDAARACVSSIQRSGQQVEVFNVSQEPKTMREIVRAIFVGAGKQMPAWHLPYRPVDLLAKIAALPGSLISRKLAGIPDLLQKWVANDSYDGGKFNHSLRFFCSVPMVGGLVEEVNWIKSQEGE